MALDLKEIRLECLKLVSGNVGGSHAKYHGTQQTIDNADILVEYVFNGKPKPNPETTAAPKAAKKKATAKPATEDKVASSMMD